jgi:hypothetical protein
LLRHVFSLFIGMERPATSGIADRRDVVLDYNRSRAVCKATLNFPQQILSAPLDFDGEPGMPATGATIASVASPIGRQLFTSSIAVIDERLGLDPAERGDANRLSRL